MPVLSPEDHEHFRTHGYLVRHDLVSAAERDELLELYDRDRAERGYRWRAYGHHQQANYDALVTTPQLDRAVRHPRILSAIVELMGGPVCFGEIGARWMGPYDGALHQGWHRDKPHRTEHPLRMDYIQLMLYLSDVDETTHCFSLSPESVDEPVLDENEAQLARGGCTDIHGPAGTVCLFNVAVLHTATTRPTRAERKTLQVYYGHRGRAPLANDSVIPMTLARAQDPETRAFYGNLNEVTRLYMRAFCVEDAPAADAPAADAPAADAPA